MAVDLRQTHFRFGIEELLEATHGWYQAEDVNHSQEISADWAFLLRFVEQEAGGTAAANTDAQFQYNKNGAGWVDITTTSPVVKAVASVAFTNGQACTKRLSGTGTFETTGAGCTEDGSSGGTANDIAASGNSETEAGLQVVFANVANNDTIQFRFTSPDWAVTYTVTPTLTITVSAPVVVTPAPAFAISGIVAPTVILGSLSIIPDPGYAIAGKVDPLVILGSITIIPSPVSAIAGIGNPTVIIETPGVTVTPSPAFAVAGVVAPEVILGSIVIIPSPVSGVAGVVAPIVIHGSIVIIPATIDAIGGRSNPTVDIQTVVIYITPDGAEAVGITKNFTYQLAGKIHRKFAKL